ncbi:MAG: prenyltransferase/squalene oxidase repeat-containing protein [Pirellulales bacterium]
MAENPAAASIQRAVAFLSTEVPRWERENGCFSCHNNGDAARALMLAGRSGALPDRKPLDVTLKFLAAPESWDANGPDGPFKDQKLARIQFAAALAEAHDTRLLDKPAAMSKAAALVGELQLPEGYWETDAPGTVGSPVTYGRALATAVCQQVLRQAGGDPDEAVLKAQRWFEQAVAKSVLDAAATMLGLAANRSEAAEARRAQCWQLIRQGQSSDGGWGPFVNSPPDVFDTAVVLLALSSQRDQAYVDAIERGRRYLLAEQESDGGWPATTRPPGVDSYAQRISTTGWALQALLAGE